MALLNPLSQCFAIRFHGVFQPDVNRVVHQVVSDRDLKQRQIPQRRQVFQIQVMPGIYAQVPRQQLFPPP